MDEARRALLAAAAVVPHTDADGLAAGAIALRARGEGAGAAILLGRGETPFTASFGEEPRATPPAPLAILDWGVRPGAPEGSLLVDHHVLDTGVDAGAVTVVHGDVPTAALMRRLVTEAPAWLAAVGAVGDLGDAAFALPECVGAPKTAVRKLVPLVDAPRRLPDGPIHTALALLVEHDDPRAALADPRADELRAAKAAWRAEFDRVVRTAPRVGERVAVLRFSSPAQVHPLVATTWARRLAPRVVLAANDDYLPGHVNFAVRGGHDGEDLRDVLHAAGLDPVHGHARATGGSLPPPDFERLLAALSS